MFRSNPDFFVVSATILYVALCTGRMLCGTSLKRRFYYVECIRRANQFPFPLSRTESDAGTQSFAPAAATDSTGATLSPPVVRRHNAAARFIDIGGTANNNNNKATDNANNATDANPDDGLSAAGAVGVRRTSQADRLDDAAAVGRPPDWRWLQHWQHCRQLCGQRQPQQRWPNGAADGADTDADAAEAGDLEASGVSIIESSSGSSCGVG